MSQETAKRVLKIEAEAIAELIPRLGESFDQAVELLAKCRGRMVAMGMGKSGIVCRKIAATFNSTGTPSIFLHPAEAIHGDLGMLATGDIVLALSNSGETDELVDLVSTIKRLGIPLISMVGNMESTLAHGSDIALDVGVNQEACPFGLAPTASTTASMALGDALALALSEKKGFHLEDFALLHPGGKLGKVLAKVGDLMHRGEQIPKVALDALMDEVIYEMSNKKLGVTSVVDSNGGLVGVISDGDLRRLLQKKRERVLSFKASQCMTKDPLTISEDELGTSALHIMEENKITSLMVTDGSNNVVGIIHLHDLWRTEMI
ncbi:MAG: KpsF/GutQ family sugar-phosphate isomerase [Acidobacteriota bacterium]|nr:KpsF/GutQ family sugar-phosphate isomerase [Acidobacteriota bacterium]